MDIIFEKGESTNTFLIYKTLKNMDIIFKKESLQTHF